MISLICLGYSVASDSSLWSEIDLSYVSEECLYRLPRTLVRRLKSVESFRFTRQTLLYPYAVENILSIVQHSHRLSSISFSHIRVTDKMLIDLFSNSKGSLRHVDMSICQIGSDCIISLVKHHPKLLTLDLSYTMLMDEGLLCLHHLENLTDLSLQGCYHLTYPCMAEFLRHKLPPRISKLNLSYLLTVHGEWLATLPSQAKFERLDVRHVDSITRKDVQSFHSRWGSGCEVLSTAKLESDDEDGWRQYVEEIITAQPM